MHCYVSVHSMYTTLTYLDFYYSLSLLRKAILVQVDKFM